MRQAIVHAGVTANRYSRISLADYDRSSAARVVVIASGIGEGPAGSAAGHVGEARSEAEAGETYPTHSSGRAGRTMRRAIIDAGVTAHRYRCVSLADCDRSSAAGVVVIAGCIRECPAGAAAGHVGKARSQVET